MEYYISEYYNYSFFGGNFYGATSVKPRVLCVDDQYGIRTLLNEILKYDFDVMTVETGEEAIESFQKFVPHVVILDMNLNEMKGTDLLRIIKQINNNIGTIMLTGYQDRDLIDEIKESNPEKIIYKPFQVEQIISSVKELSSMLCEQKLV